MSQVTKTSQPAPNVLIQQLPIPPQQQSVSGGQRQHSVPFFSTAQQQQLQFSPGQALGSPSQHSAQHLQCSPLGSGASQLRMQKPPLHPQKQEECSHQGTARSTAGSHYGGGIFLGVFDQIDNMSPLSLSRLGKELTQEAVNRMGELFAYSKVLELPNPSRQQEYLIQRQKMLSSFVELLHYLRTLMKKIAEIRAKLESERRQNLNLDINKLDEDEMLNLLLGKAARGPVSEIKRSKAYQDMQAEKEQLVDQLSLKRDQLTDIADFMRSLEWEIGALLGKE